MTISRKDFGLETHPLVSTLGTHRAYLFMVELNKEINFLLECKYDNFVINWIKQVQAKPKVRKKEMNSTNWAKLTNIQIHLGFKLLFVDSPLVSNFCYLNIISQLKNTLCSQLTQNCNNQNQYVVKCNLYSRHDTRHSHKVVQC